MFLNKTPINNVSPHFTTEFYNLLSSFEQLDLHSGIDDSSDAVLLGIVDSPDRLTEAITVQDSKLVKTLVNVSDIGERNDFFTPIKNRINLELRVILIKRPSANDIKFLTGLTPGQIVKHPKVIFDDRIVIKDDFEREVLSFGDLDEGGQTNFSRNLGNIQKSLKRMARNAANSFKENIIYVF